MIIIMASLGITSGHNAPPSPSNETNTIASISVPDLDPHHGTVIDTGMVTNNSHQHHRHYHLRRPLPLVLEMADRSNSSVTNLKDMGMSMHMGSTPRPEDSEYCLATPMSPTSPTSPTSPNSVKTVVGRDSYTGTGSWTSYKGHLKGRGVDSGDHDRSMSGPMMNDSYAYAHGSPVTGDMEARTIPGATVAHSRVPVRYSEKGRGL